MRRSQSIGLALVVWLGLALPSSAGAQAALNVAYLPKQVTNSYFDVAATGGMHAASELGGQFKQVGPQTSNGAEQVPFIEQLTTERVGAIVVSAADPEVTALALQEARQAGIKVVGYDSSPAPGAYDVFVNQVDAQSVGQQLVLAACDEAPGCSGDIAVLSSTPTASNQNAWIAAMKQALAQPQYAGLNLVDVLYGNDDPQTSQQATEALLQEDPNLKVIVSPTTIGILAAAIVLEATGNAERVQLTGLGTPNDMRPYVADGTVKELGLWNVEDLGYLAYYVAAKLISGEIQGNPGETFSVPTLGDFTIDDNHVVTLGPCQVFTADNIDQFSF
jgi:rhamnose transport system substrate-binding protein